MVDSDEVLLKGVLHVSLVVYDADKTAEKLGKYGIGPFTFYNSNYRSPVPGKYEARARMKYGYCQAGNILWELMETLEGETEYSDFLETHGEGIHHLGFPTSLPIEVELEKWSKRGVKATKSGKEGEAGEGWAYMDTVDDMGFIVEILSYKMFSQYLEENKPAFSVPFLDQGSSQ